MSKFNFPEYGICSNIANRLAVDAPSTIALRYIKSMLQCIVTALLLGNFNRSVLNSVGGSDFRLFDGSDLKTYLLMRW